MTSIDGGFVSVFREACKMFSSRDGFCRWRFIRRGLGSGGRWLMASVLAAAVALFLSLLMSRLVETDNDAIHASVHLPLRVPDFVRVRNTPEPIPERRFLPPRPVLAESRRSAASQEPALPLELLETSYGEDVSALLSPQASALLRYLPAMDDDRDAGDLIEVSGSRVLRRIDPVYPPFAERQGIEGWVRIIFAVAEDGSVVNAHVSDADPQGVFDRSALAAISRWRYQPPVMDGRHVRREDVEVTFKFRLE